MAAGHVADDPSEFKASILRRASRAPSTLHAQCFVRFGWPLRLAFAYTAVILHTASHPRSWARRSEEPSAASTCHRAICSPLLQIVRLVVNGIR